MKIVHGHFALSPQLKSSLSHEGLSYFVKLSGVFVSGASFWCGCLPTSSCGLFCLYSFMVVSVCLLWDQLCRKTQLYFDSSWLQSPVDRSISYVTKCRTFPSFSIASVVALTEQDFSSVVLYLLNLDRTQDYVVTAHSM